MLLGAQFAGGARSALRQQRARGRSAALARAHAPLQLLALCLPNCQLRENPLGLIVCLFVESTTGQQLDTHARRSLTWRPPRAPPPRSVRRPRGIRVRSARACVRAGAGRSQHCLPLSCPGGAPCPRRALPACAARSWHSGTRVCGGGACDVRVPQPAQLTTRRTGFALSFVLSTVPGMRVVLPHTVMPGAYASVRVPMQGLRCCASRSLPLLKLGKHTGLVARPKVPVALLACSAGLHAAASHTLRLDVKPAPAAVRCLWRAVAPQRARAVLRLPVEVATSRSAVVTHAGTSVTADEGGKAADERQAGAPHCVVSGNRD